MTDWAVESLRLTAMLSAPAEGHAEWWSNVAGGAPEEQQSRPQEGLFSYGGALSQTTLEGSRLVLQIKPSRVDWRLQGPSPSTEGAPKPIPGILPEILPAFASLTQGWLNSVPSATRIAYGGELRISAENQRDANLTINEFLPFEVDEDSSDLIYRVNRPRIVAIDGKELRINRLSTWKVERTAILALRLNTSAGSVPLAQSSISPEEVVCSMAFDVNTTPQEEPLPASLLPALSENLWNLALEIASQGDKP